MLMQRKYDAVLFDFDGTVADTGVGIFNSIQYAAECVGHAPLSNEVLRTFIGPPVYDSFKRELGLDDKECEFAVNKYREKYSESGIYQLEMYDGMRELLAELKSNDIKIGIASSKPESFILRLLNIIEIGGFVDFVSCPAADKANREKFELINSCAEHFGIEKSKIVMVGDRLFDINGANIAGVDSIGVTFGYGSKEELENAGATRIASSVDEIRDIIFQPFCGQE